MKSLPKSTQLFCALPELSKPRLHEQFPVPARSYRRLLSGIALGLLMPLSNANAGAVSYSYDALGRLSQVVYSGDISATTTYVYDENGNWTTVTTTVPKP